MERSRSTGVTSVLIGALALVSLAVGATACVDGKTPDCSDAADMCNPDFDAYPDDSGGEASAADSSPVDSSADASADTATQQDSAPEAGSD